MTITPMDGRGRPFLGDFEVPEFCPDILGPALSLDKLAVLTHEVLTDAGGFREIFQGGGGRIPWVQGWQAFSQKMRKRMVATDDRSFSHVVGELESAWGAIGGKKISWRLAKRRLWNPGYGYERSFERILFRYGEAETAYAAAVLRVIKEHRAIAYRPVLDGRERVPSDEWKRFAIPLPGVNSSALRWAKATCRFLFTTDLPPEILGGTSGSIVQRDKATGAFHKSRVKKGRPKGTGYDDADELLINACVELIDCGDANSAQDAAQRIYYLDPGKVAGNGSPDSKIRRLARRTVERRSEIAP